MRKMLLVILLLISFFNTCLSQTCVRTVAYDYMETFTWAGVWWTSPPTTGYFTNASVTPTASAAIYGLGAGGSAIEQDWYSMPNITGLNAGFTYKFKFRMASYKFSNPGGAAAGVDLPDFVDVQLSTNGGVTYISEMRITGNNNATWNYNNALAAKTANGVLTTYSPGATGGDRTAIGDGYSDIELTLPAGTTQCAVDILCRVNAGGEEWWLDNIELLEYYPCSLPIELLEFTGEPYNDYNVLKWITASETNNDYFTIERSFNAVNFEEVGKTNGAGTSTTTLSYSLTDIKPFEGVTYYRLTQTDYNGQKQTFNIISVSRMNTGKNLIVNKITNLLGQDVPEDYDGVKIYYFSDGSVIKKYIIK